MSIPKSYSISTGKGWKCVLLGNLNGFNLNCLWFKWLIPREHQLRAGHRLIFLDHHVLPSLNKETPFILYNCYSIFSFFSVFKICSDKINVRSLARFVLLFAAQQFVHVLLIIVLVTRCFQDPVTSKTAYQVRMLLFVLL